MSPIKCPIHKVTCADCLEFEKETTTTTTPKAARSTIFSRINNHGSSHWWIVSRPGSVALESSTRALFHHQSDLLSKVLSCLQLLQGKQELLCSSIHMWLLIFCSQEAYARFSNEMLMYFESKANLPYITMFDCSNENFILNSMFILKQNNEYFRVRVQEILPDNTVCFFPQPLSLISSLL